MAAIPLGTGFAFIIPPSAAPADDVLQVGREPHPIQNRTASSSQQCEGASWPPETINTPNHSTTARIPRAERGDRPSALSPRMEAGTALSQPDTYALLVQGLEQFLRIPWKRCTPQSSDGVGASSGRWDGKAQQAGSRSCLWASPFSKRGQNLVADASQSRGRSDDSL